MSTEKPESASYMCSPFDKSGCDSDTINGVDTETCYCQEDNCNGARATGAHIIGLGIALFLGHLV